MYTGMFTGGGAVINTTGRRVVQDAKEGTPGKADEAKLAKQHTISP